MQITRFTAQLVAPASVKSHSGKKAEGNHFASPLSTDSLHFGAARRTAAQIAADDEALLKTYRHMLINQPKLFIADPSVFNKLPEAERPAVLWNKAGDRIEIPTQIRAALFDEAMQQLKDPDSNVSQMNGLFHHTILINTLCPSKAIAGVSEAEPGRLQSLSNYQFHDAADVYRFLKKFKIALETKNKPEDLRACVKLGLELMSLLQKDNKSLGLPDGVQTYLRKERLKYWLDESLNFLNLKDNNEIQEMTKQF
jgi:hypothetical protein